MDIMHHDHGHEITPTNDLTRAFDNEGVPISILTPYGDMDNQWGIINEYTSVSLI